MDQVREDPDMRRHFLTPAVLAFFALTCVVSTASAEREVQVTMTAHRITTTDRGAERLVKAEQAKPGETIEYRARYLNPGDAAVRQLVASIPIPEGTEYMPGTAAPAQVFASVDGKNFAPAPLKRRVRLPNGKEAEVDVPAREYRALRWTIGTLAASGERTVSARVRVTPVGVAANVEN
jgi:uncharacterized repeat protein (TIGR01451 family)